MSCHALFSFLLLRDTRTGGAGVACWTPLPLVTSHRRCIGALDTCIRYFGVRIRYERYVPTSLLLFVLHMFMFRLPLAPLVEASTTTCPPACHSF
eukprot:6180981-Pleurochrysis_carterae.AAC.1